MPNVAFFIDLPNFYSRLLKSGIENPRVLRDYFLEWLDFDLLAHSLVDDFTGIWVFYSGERIGPSSERISGEIFLTYIRRINTLQGVTARDVNIRGEQREGITYKCENCEYEGKSEFVSEKGVDSSLTVHLFDTIDSWDVAYLLSGDADFVPVVASLRRRGKIVVGAGFSDASEALVRECYDYVNLSEEFLYDDVLAFKLFRREGLVYQWLTMDVNHSPEFTEPAKLTFIVGLNMNDAQFMPPSVSFYCSNEADLTSRRKLMDELESRFSKKLRKNKSQAGQVLGYNVFISPHGFEAISRKASHLVSSIQGLSTERKDHYQVFYSLNPNSKVYEPIKK